MRIEPTCVVEMYSDKSFQNMVDEYSLHRIKTLPLPQYRQADYQALEDKGLLTVFRAMAGNTLIGFSTMLDAHIPHYGIKLSIVESLFVCVAYRPTGAGLRLIRASERAAKGMGSVGLFINCPDGGALMDVLPRIGYTLETHTFFKRL